MTSPIYLIHGNLMVGYLDDPQPNIGHGVDKATFFALIKENENIPNETVTLAIKYYYKQSNEQLFKYVTSGLKKNYFHKIVKTEVPLHDLPLYIDWPWKTPEFMELLKGYQQ